MALFTPGALFGMLVPVETSYLGTLNIDVRLPHVFQAFFDIHHVERIM